MRWIHIIIVVLFVAAIAVFALQNLGAVTMSFHLSYEVPRAAAVSACAERDSSSAASRLFVSTLEPPLFA